MQEVTTASCWLKLPKSVIVEKEEDRAQDLVKMEFLELEMEKDFKGSNYKGFGQIQ